MKSIWREIILAVIMGMFLPGILLNWAVDEEKMGVEQEENHVQLPTEESLARQPVMIRLKQSDGTNELIPLEEYLVGVILGELPSEFALEAKKAQAVAARTFTCKADATGGKHGDGSVCINPSCCQAYLSPGDYMQKGGTQQGLETAALAVKETEGYVLKYQGQLIEATYFSCSGGSTEDAVAVWGTDFPYLRATSSPGEEKAVHYSDTVYLSKENLEKKLSIVLSGESLDWIGRITYTAGGGVDTAEIGGQTYSGTELRSRLGLRSTAFTAEADVGGITFVTRGFGHRVGMSQYGADAMAEAGSTWQEILSHYYQGATLELTNDHD